MYDHVSFWFSCLTVCGHIISSPLYVMRSQDGRWVYWRCSWVERTAFTTVKTAPCISPKYRVSFRSSLLDPVTATTDSKNVFDTRTTKQGTTTRPSKIHHFFCSGCPRWPVDFPRRTVTGDTIVNRTYGSQQKNVHLPIFTNNIWPFTLVPLPRWLGGNRLEVKHPKGGAFYWHVLFFIGVKFCIITHRPIRPLWRADLPPVYY